MNKLMDNNTLFAGHSLIYEGLTVSTPLTNNINLDIILRFNFTQIKENIKLFLNIVE